jgi:hypothetical protein
MHASPSWLEHRLTLPSLLVCIPAHLSFIASEQFETSSKTFQQDSDRVPASLIMSDQETAGRAGAWTEEAKVSCLATLRFQSRMRTTD